MIWFPGLLLAAFALLFALVVALRDMWAGPVRQLPPAPKSLERAE